MKKLMVTSFALAIAWAFSATAGTEVNWFNGGIGLNWPNDATMSGGAWTTDSAGDPTELTAGYTAENGLELDAGDDQLEFTNGVQRVLGASAGTDSVTYTSAMQLYPFTSVPEEVEAGAKAGLILVTTDSKTYVYAIGKEDGVDGNQWQKLDDSDVDPSVAATVTITAAKGTGDNALSVTYTYNNGEVVIGPIAKTVYVSGENAYKFTKTSYTGSGYVQSLSATAVATTYNFTIDAASLAGEGLVATVKSGATGPDGSGNYTYAYGDTVVITYSAADGYVMESTDKAFEFGTVPDEFNASNVPEGVEAKVGYFYFLIGDVKHWYETLDDAMAAAPLDTAVEIVAGAKGASAATTFTGKGLSIAVGRYANGLTIDFNGNSYEFTCGYGGADDPRAIYILKNNKITLKNGTLKASAEWADKISVKVGEKETNRPFGEFIRSFTQEVTLDNMTLDAQNMKMAGGRGVQFLNGDLIITNNTSILKPTAASATDFYAVKQGNYTSDSSYNTGKLVLDSGTIEGNFLFCGGEQIKRNATLVDSKYYFGHVMKGIFDVDKATGFGFVAYSGTIATEMATDNDFHTDGELYTTLGAAAAGFAEYEGSKLTMLADVADAGGITLDDACNLNLNGKSITIPNGDTLTVNGALTVTDSSDPQAGKLVVAGAIDANADINLYAIGYGTAGLVQHQGGSLDIAANVTVTFMQAWAGTSAGQLDAFTPGFLVKTTNSKINTGAVYTYDGSVWVVADAVAKAEVDREVYGQQLVYTETYTTLAAAIANLKANGKVTLLDAVTLAQGETIAAGQTLDLDGNTFTIPAGMTLTLNGTLKCDDTGSNYVNLGSMLLSSTSVVYMGETKMFGATDDETAKFSIQSGSVTQVAIDGNPLTGMQYTVSAGGATAMRGDFPLWSADPKVYMNNKFYLDNGASLTATAADKEQAKICVLALNDGYVIEEVSGVYTAVEAPTGLTFTLAATGITGTPTYKIGDDAAVEFKSVSGKWQATGLADNTVLVVLYTADSSFTTPGAIWAVKSGATRDGAQFTLTTVDAEATLTVYDQGGASSEATAKNAIDAAAAAEGCTAAQVTKIDNVITGVGSSVKVANWVAGNSAVTYAAIADADQEDAEVSCLVGATQVVADPTMTLTSLDATTTVGTYDIKVKLTSGSGTDALKYAVDTVKELFEASYDLGSGTTGWSKDNVTATPPVGDEENEATFRVSPSNSSAAAAFIRLKIKADAE